MPGCKFGRSLFPSCLDRSSNLLPTTGSRLRTRIESTLHTTGQAFAHLSAKHVHAIKRELKALFQRLVQATKSAIKTLAKVFSSTV